MPRRPLNFCLPVLMAFIVAVAVGLTEARAQDLKRQTTPFSVYLDFEVGAQNSSLPIWLESVARQRLDDANGRAARTVFRLNFRRLGELTNDLLLRIFYDDDKGAAPIVSGYSADGAPHFLHGPFGAGLELPSSELIRIPMGSIDLIEIEVPGDGSNLHGAFVSTLKKSGVWHALDFAPESDFLDPFRNSPTQQPDADDLALYDRIRAVIDPLIMKLAPRETPSGVWEFDLGRVPAFAVISFEGLNLDTLEAPEITINGRALGPASVQIPDLADPAFRSVVRAKDPDVRFRYAGWLRCQKAIPASILVEGMNSAVIEVSKKSGPVAVRAIEIQLKND